MKPSSSSDSGSHRPWFAIFLVITAAVGTFCAVPANAHGQIFVTNQTENAPNNFIWEIGKYNLDGTTVNGSLITGLRSSNFFAVDGSNIYTTAAPNSFDGDGSIGKYTTSGGSVNSTLVTGLTKTYGWHRGLGRISVRRQ